MTTTTGVQYVREGAKGFYLKLAKMGVAWNDVTAFDIELLRFVPSEGRAHVDTSEDLRRQQSDTAWLNETPAGKRTFALFRIAFRDGPKDIMAGVRYTNAEGAIVSYEGNLSLRIDVVHQPQGGILYGLQRLVQQCTVFCPISGESRSGPHACIDCRKGQSVVRICC